MEDLLHALRLTRFYARAVLWDAFCYVEANYNLNEFNGALEAIRTLTELHNSIPSGGPILR